MSFPVGNGVHITTSGLQFSPNFEDEGPGDFQESWLVILIALQPLKQRSEDSAEKKER